MKKQISSKKSILTIIGAFLIAVIVILIYARDSYSEIKKNFVHYELKKLSRGKIDLLSVSLEKLEQDELWVYEKSSKRQVHFNNNPIGNLQFSPSGQRAGFMEFRDVHDKNISITEQVIFHIGLTNGKKYQAVYHGDFKTSGWEWLNENELVVYDNCGTECVVGFLYDVRDGKKEADLWAVGHEWSPDKQMILSYNYTIGYGVMVQDKKGEDLFLIARQQPIPYNKLMDETRAIWSPDSTKLALAIRKETENRMELLIYNTKDNFKIIYQANMLLAEVPEIRWSDNSKNIVHGDLVVNLN